MSGPWRQGAERYAWEHPRDSFDVRSHQGASVDEQMPEDDTARARANRKRAIERVEDRLEDLAETVTLLVRRIQVLSQQVDALEDRVIASEREGAAKEFGAEVASMLYRRRGKRA